MRKGELIARKTDVDSMRGRAALNVGKVALRARDIQLRLLREENGDAVRSIPVKNIKTHFTFIHSR